MASFQTLAFGERGQGGTHFPSHSAAMTSVLHRIPGGSRIVMQRTSTKEHELTTTAKTDYAGYLALLGMVGESGALVLGGQTGTGRLMAIGSATEIHISDVFFVDLTFQWVSGALIDTPPAAGGYGNNFGNAYGA